MEEKCEQEKEWERKKQVLEEEQADGEEEEID